MTKFPVFWLTLDQVPLHFLQAPQNPNYPLPLLEHMQTHADISCVLPEDFGIGVSVLNHLQPCRR